MDNDSDALGQAEIDALLRPDLHSGDSAPEQSDGDSASSSSSPAATMETPPPKSEPVGAPPAQPAPERADNDIDLLMQQTMAAIQSVDDPSRGSPDGIHQFRLSNFTGSPASKEQATLDLIRDVDLEMRIELGRTHMYLEDVLRLKKGAVVPLDKLAGDPVDVYINGRLVARGEVLVLNDNFCIRVAELVSGNGAA